jgi:hypothetical protein
MSEDLTFGELTLEQVRYRVEGFIINHPGCEYYQILRELLLYDYQGLMYQALEEMIKAGDVRHTGYSVSLYVGSFTWNSQPRLL